MIWSPSTRICRCCRQQHTYQKQIQSKVNWQFGTTPPRNRRSFKTVIAGFASGKAKHSCRQLQTQIMLINSTPLDLKWSNILFIEWNTYLLKPRHSYACMPSASRQLCSTGAALWQNDRCAYEKLAMRNNSINFIKIHGDAPFRSSSLTQIIYRTDFLYVGPPSLKKIVLGHERLLAPRPRPTPLIQPFTTPLIQFGRNSIHKEPNEILGSYRKIWDVCDKTHKYVGNCFSLRPKNFPNNVRPGILICRPHTINSNSNDNCRFGQLDGEKSLNTNYTSNALHGRLVIITRLHQPNIFPSHQSIIRDLRFFLAPCSVWGCFKLWIYQRMMIFCPTTYQWSIGQCEEGAL